MKPLLPAVLAVCALVFLIAAGAALAADPPYYGTIFIDPGIVTEADPTAYQGLDNARQRQRFVFDRRPDAWSTVSMYVFDVHYDDGLLIEAQVNPEFGGVAAAREQAERYARMVGQLPRGLRIGVRTLTIHRGNELLGGGGHDILIHTEHAEASMQKGVLEEELMHEAAHSSLDTDHKTDPAWLEAQRADGNFISEYARDFPNREDIAESFNAYFIARQRADRVPASTLRTIERTMPKRIAYFAAQRLDMYPALPERWSQPVYGAGRHGLGTTLSYVVAGTTDVLAEIEYVGYALHNGRWVIVIFNDPPLPQDDPCHGMTHEYQDLATGNWVACLRHGELLAELTPHRGFFRFPMRAGDRWSRWMRWTDHVRPAYSSRGSFSHTFEVEACGVEVEVPAGAFTTCRVSYLAADPHAAPDIRWYDPALDLVVRSEQGGTVYELWDYDLAAPGDCGC